MTVGVIRNPHSGRGAGTKEWPLVEARLRSILGERLSRCEPTTRAGSAGAQARAMAAEGIEIVVAAGGDGTVCDTLQGLVGTSTALAVLPLGTGNDFARTLGFGTNLEGAITAIEGGRTQRMDVGHWRVAGREGYFINVAGCGFDAMVADRINTGIRRLRGSSAYLYAIVTTLLSYKATKLTLSIDGKVHEVEAMLCAIANATCYGGGVLISPDSDPTDGSLDLVIVGKLSKLAFLRSFPRVIKGTHLTHPSVQVHRCTKLEIRSDPPVPFLVDGELLPPGRLEVEVVPGVISVVVP